MNRIAIYLDGAEVNKLDAAEALNVLNGLMVSIHELNEIGRIQQTVEVYPRRTAHGGVQAPYFTWSSGRTHSNVDAGRAHAAMITLAAEMTDLAELLFTR